MINFFGPCNYLGYGIHTYNLIKSFVKVSGSEVTLIPPFGSVSFTDDNIERWLYSRTTFDKNNPGIMLFHPEYFGQFCGNPRIGFAVFELDNFPAIATRMMNQVDFLLTPSKWGRNVLIDNGYSADKIFVVPEGYDPVLFHSNYPFKYKVNRIEKRGITFAHVGKWEVRKGTPDIFSAFACLAEKTKEKVTLIAHVQNHFDSYWDKSVGRHLASLGFRSGEVNIHARQSLGDHVIKADKGNVSILIPLRSTFSFRDMGNLYRDADFGIWLSRAEGWNLPLLECIACGTPSLTTSWTGMSEYLEDYPKELKVDEGHKILANDGKFFNGDRGTWLVPDPDVVINKLVDMIENYEDYLMFEGHCLLAVKKFTWENSANKLVEVLKEIGVKL